jgi:short-subunit dehydrogenase
MNTAQFHGKIIWIIGASTGIGETLAKSLASKGARLILSARQESKLKVLKKELGHDHLILALDVSIKESYARAIDEIHQTFDHIDSVIFMAADYEPMALSELNLERVQSIVATNLLSVFFLLERIIPFYRKQGHGQIVLCASVAGYCGLPYGQPYSATKAALINLAESLYCEEKKNNIDIKVINPGFVKTPMTDKNDFSMPMMISPQEASESIIKGLLSSSFEIHFPKKFTYLMKILRLLPYRLYFKLIQKSNRRK